jgi:hypothetical protein
MKRSRTTDAFLSLLAGVALALAAAGPALAKGGGGGGGGSPCDVLLDTSDIDFDGFSDLEECQGLSNAAAFTYPGCLTTPAAVPNCLDPNVQDLFVEIQKDLATTGTSGFDESFGGLGPISDDELFEFVEAPASAGGLGINVHVVPQGSFDPGLRPRGVTARQSGVVLFEDRSLGFGRDGAGDLICPDPPPPTGLTFQGNPNEFGNPQVLTQRIFDRIDCVFGNLQTPGNFEDKRTHLKNTAAHELGHTIEAAPDATSHHTSTLSGCLMDAAIQPEGRRKVSLPIPTVFCENSQQAVAAGITAEGQTVLCGDNTTFDGDPVESCLTPPGGP